MQTKKFLVHRDVVGSLKHVLYDSGKISWSDDLVTPEWVFDRNEGSVDKCLKTLLRVNGLEVEYNPGAVNQKVYSKILPAHVKSIPWSLCLPVSIYKETLKNFLDAVSLMDVDNSYYETGYRNFRRLVSKFKPFKVDEKLLRKLFDSANDSLLTHLDSLLPHEDGFVRPPTYNFFGTRTGRLTVNTGPMVLTLPKEHRNLFISSKKSRIIQIDFSSLEPRLLAALAKVSASEGDLYTELSEACFSGKLSRDKTKIAVLGILYGMSVDTLSAHIETPADDCRVILSTVKKHFKIKELLSRIERETYGDSTKNFFGKTIEINRAALLNNYIQSSGVDVAHIGFDKLMMDVEFLGIEFKPMFLVHDALVGEVSEEDFSKLSSLVANGFYCSQLNCVFPLSIGDFAKLPSIIEPLVV